MSTRAFTFSDNDRIWSDYRTVTSSAVLQDVVLQCDTAQQGILVMPKESTHQSYMSVGGFLALQIPEEVAVLTWWNKPWMQLN